MLTGREAERRVDGSYKWKLGCPVTAPSQLYTMMVRLEQMRIKASDVNIFGLTSTYTSNGTTYEIALEPDDTYEYKPNTITTALNISNTNLEFSYSDGRFSVKNISQHVIEFNDDDVIGLMQTLGFEQQFSIAVNSVVKARHGPDLTGTTFFQIEADVGVQNNGAFGRSADPVLAIVPSRIDFSDYNNAYMTYSAAEYNPHFFSCNKLRIDEIILKILNDRGDPVRLSHNWYVLLCFGHDVPDEVQQPRDPHEATTYKMLVDMDGRSYKRSGRDYRQDYNIGGAA